MKRLPRGRGRQATPAGAYDVQFRIEGSYRLHGLVLFAIGAVLFVLCMIGGELLLLFLTGPATGAGLWLYLKDPREYLVVNPRRKRIQLTRVYGRRVKVRRDFDLGEFCRLETARYDNRAKGLRCMMLLFRPDGSVEKLDDRVDHASLTDLCREVAEAAGLEYVDRGRIDQDQPRQLDGDAADHVRADA